MADRTVFHVPESDPDYGRRAYRNVENLLDDETLDPDIVVVHNGGGIDHLHSSAATAEAARQLLDAGVELTICENSLARSDHDREDYIDGLTVVPTAMGELTRLQAAGYAYIRP